MNQGVITVGSVLGGDFKILELLSSGGMGNVYVAEQLSTGSRRALKTMKPELLDTPKLRERFEQEARISGRIDSDHIVQVVSAGVDAVTATPYMVMELLEGENLREYVRARGGLSRGEVAAIFDQLCHAISAAHAIGIVHRDIKPENIFLAKGRSARANVLVKVLDFGVAKVIAEASASGTAAVGTPIWMAPEQGEVRSARIGPRTDVWALGLVAFHALTGHVYWLSARDPKVSVAAVLRELLVEPLALASDRARALGATDPLPEGFDAWFAKCVAREPGDRFGSVALLEAEFARILGVDPARVAAKQALAYRAAPESARIDTSPEMSTNAYLEKMAVDGRASAPPSGGAPPSAPVPSSGRGPSSFGAPSSGATIPFGHGGPASTAPLSKPAPVFATMPGDAHATGVPPTVPPPTERGAPISAPSELGAYADDDEPARRKKKKKRDRETREAGVVEARPLAPLAPIAAGTRDARATKDGVVPWVVLGVLILIGLTGAIWGLTSK